jgi:hypothetical protein
MKNKILELLKPKFEGVSETILGRIADKLAKTAKTDEDVNTLIEGVTFQQILESYGDSRATEAQQSAVANYEKKHGLKDGKSVKTEPKTEPKAEPKIEDDDVPAWAKAIIDSNNSLKSELEAIKGEKTTNKRKSELDKVLNKAPEKIRQRYTKDFERMSFKDDEDFNAWIGDITPDVEAITNDYNTKGGVVRRPKSGGGGNGESENVHLKARIAEREAETSAPAIIGLTNQNK